VITKSLPTRKLSERPHLDQLRRQAKELRKPLAPAIRPQLPRSTPTITTRTRRHSLSTTRSS
jgi:hypothetical protein